MGKTRQEQARQRRPATVEYVAFAFDFRGLYIGNLQFLSTPVLHVNGPRSSRYKSINQKFVSDFNKVFWEEWPTYNLPHEFTFFRVDPDGKMRAVLRLDEDGWKCLLHEDCKLRQVK